MPLNASLAVLLGLTVNGTNFYPRSKISFCTLKLALEHVNERNATIVPELANLTTGFFMNYTLLDTRLNTQRAVDLLMNYLFDSRELVADGVARAVLGPLVSRIAKPTALLAGAEQVPMVSYRASAPELSSPTYEYFTRIYPPDTTSARLLVHLLYNSSAFAGWNNVAVVHQDDAWGKGYVTEMELELRRINSKIPLREPDRESGTLLPFAITHTDSDSVKRALDAVNSSGYSVIVVVGHFLPPFSSTFEDFLEEANTSGLVTPEHAWFIVEGKSMQSASPAGPPDENQARARSLVSGMQSFQIQLGASTQPGWERWLRAMGSMTPTQCNNPFFTPSKQLFSEFLIKGGLNNYEVEAHIFDGVVAIALAMNAEDEDAEEQAPGQEVGAKLLKKLKKVSFDGASGPVALDESGNREPATIRFALESFGDPNSAEPLTLVYEVFTNAPSTTSTFEMAATRKAEVQWIGGSKQQPKDAIRQKLLEKREADEKKAAQKERDAIRRQLIMVVATCVSLLIATVAMLSLTIWWVRVRRVAHRYQVSPWQLIRDRAAAKARAVRFVFVKVHQRWLKLRNAGAIRRGRVAVDDDDDARDVRGNALLVAAGWRAGLHVQMPTQGLRDQLKRAGKTEVQAEVEPRAIPVKGGNKGGEIGGRRPGGTDGSGGDSSGNFNGSGDLDRNNDSDRTSGSRRLSSDRWSSVRRSSASLLLSRAVRGEVADPVTRRLLTASNTDWRVQPNAVDVCKAPTPAQVQANLLELEYNLTHFCELFRKYAEAEIQLDLGPSASGGGEGNGGGSGDSRMFPGLRMTEDGWLRFQSVEQLDYDTVAALKLFRTAANRRHKTPTPAAPQVHFSTWRGRSARSAEPEPDAVGSGGGGGSLTFVEFVKLLLSPANRTLNPAALVPEEGHADAPLSHFWIATSHNSYVVGNQLTGYADEAMYRRQLLQGCRSLEIDCWNGARGEPVVTHGNTLVNKISFASVAKAVSETAFVTSQAPVLLSLEMHCGEKQQARIAELLKKELGALLVTCAELKCLSEARSPAVRKLEGYFGEHPSERELPFQALQGRVLLKAKLPPLTPDNADDKPDDDSSTPEATSMVARESRESVVTSLPSERPNAKPNAKAASGSKGVIEPSLRALITMPSVPAPRFMAGNLPAGVQGLPISSLSEPLLQGIFAAAGEDLRAEAAARVQLTTRGWQARGFPRGTRIKSDNADPLFQWGMGVQQVALNLQTNDTPTQLHYALFALSGGCGYVLKPREMRAEPPEAWPPARATLHRATITLLSLHQLPTPDEERPALARGHRRACHTYVPELSGEYTGPSVSSVSSPSVSIELHPIGGYCCVGTALPPSPGAGRAHTTQAVEKSGFNACFSNELPVHCLAAEPRETLLRVGVWDHGTLVAYDTLVLGTLRAGHRCIQLRSRLGTRIELCHLFVHVALGEEVNTGASSLELREELQKEKALVEGLRRELRARRAWHPDVGEAGAEAERPVM